MPEALEQNQQARSRRFRAYPEYKDSGVEWMGEIPAHWQVKKVKRLCLVRRGASPRPIEDQIYFDDDGEYAWVRIADVTASDRYLEVTTQRLSELGESRSVALEPGELFLSIAATVGKPIITKIKCCIHDGFVYFVGLRENREYLYYLFSCGEPYKGLGKLGTQLNLNTDTIGDICIPLPTWQEQQTVVLFLDRATAKIDGLVARKERLCELLQEKRTALITRAVTRGLDPNVPMKDSGVEWLGEIPAHWEVMKLSWLTKCLDGRRIPLNAEQRGRMQGEYPYWGANSIVDHVHEWLFDEELVLLGEDGAPFFDRSRPVAFRVAGKIWVNNHAHVLRPQSVIDAKFLKHVLNRVDYRAFIDGSTRDKLTQGDMNGIPVQCPGVGEQRAIADYLDQETAKVDALIAKVREAIDLLKEFRTALISASVTGKIDVRGQAS